MRSAFLNRCDDDDATKETNEGEEGRKATATARPQSRYSILVKVMTVVFTY